MKKKIIPVIIALLLIFIIGGSVVGKMLWDKYSYSTETVDLDEYFKVSGDRYAIVLQDEMIEEQAVVRQGICYLDLDSIRKYLNDTFYVDRGEGLLLYTTADEVISVGEGEQSYTGNITSGSLDYPIWYVENDTIYIAMEYVRLFTNYSFELFERQLQVYTEWGNKDVADVKKNTAVRLKGGVKSPILRKVEMGEQVEILEKMETWSKVKTSDSIIGYIENKQLENENSVAEIAPSHYQEPEYESLSVDGKVCLGFHAVAATAGNSTLESVISQTKGMNIVAPTWFSLVDEEGNYRSFGERSYVERAHGYGLQVWGVLDDFNYNNETKSDIKVYNVLSATSKRQKLVRSITDEAVALGLDGLNLDFERLSSDCGEHYAQFLRELSIACHDAGLVLSVDNYVPFHFNEYYRLDVQGKAVDYVIIMGYDEHWHNSGDPGSVASIDYVSGGIERTLEDVPAEKIVNALPFYTILWRIEGANVTDEYLTLNNTADFLKRISVKPEWDETTCQNFAEWTSGSATYRIWFEDADSISVKLNVMKANKIGGVAVWRLGYGTQHIWELINLYVNS